MFTSRRAAVKWVADKIEAGPPRTAVPVRAVEDLETASAAARELLESGPGQ
jgi:hypothetical protein